MPPSRATAEASPESEYAYAHAALHDGYGGAEISDFECFHKFEWNETEQR